MMSKYTVHCMKFNNKTKRLKSELHDCINGSALYETLYELEVHNNELLDFNEISMFKLEQLVQSKKDIYLKSDEWEEIVVTWFPGEVQTIPKIAITDTEYPKGYNGYSFTGDLT